MSSYSELIEKICYLTIATVDPDGQPWNTPVYGAYDTEGNFYWGSNTESQHSKNIYANPKVFIVVYDSTVSAGEGEGAYIRAVAEEIIEESEILRVHSLIQSRRKIPYWTLQDVQGESPIRLFKAAPLQKWLNSEGEKNGVYIDTRIEVTA
jgi:nitroimidazol reductase NimA-like FMN-containing flavoprotein (pyridoxamine 5'-phosphate oxidase superfamily)